MPQMQIMFLLDVNPMLVLLAEKMRSGIPLNDVERAPWLAALASVAAQHIQQASSPSTDRGSAISTTEQHTRDSCCRSVPEANSYREDQGCNCWCINRERCSMNVQAVISCSALKKKYRDMLRQGASAQAASGLSPHHPSRRSPLAFVSRAAVLVTPRHLMHNLVLFYVWGFPPMLSSSGHCPSACDSLVTCLQ